MNDYAQLFEVPVFLGRDELLIGMNIRLSCGCAMSITKIKTHCENTFCSVNVSGLRTAQRCIGVHLFRYQSTNHVSTWTFASSKNSRYELLPDDWVPHEG